MIVQGYKDLDALPSSLRFYGASDYATMEPEPGKKEPDFSEHGVVGLDAIGDFWFVDWWYDQVETDVSIRAFNKMVGLYKPVKWWNEGGVIDRAIMPAIRQSMRLTNRWVVIEKLVSITDKSTKLQAFHARAHAGCVHFPIRRKWSEHVMEQLVKFPGGRWDDAADVCGLLGRGVDLMVEASIPSVQRRPMLVPFTEKWLTWNEDNQKPKVRFF